MPEYKPLDLQKMGAGYTAGDFRAPTSPQTSIMVKATRRSLSAGQSPARRPSIALHRSTGQAQISEAAAVKPPRTAPPERAAGLHRDALPDFPGCHPTKKVGGQSCEMNSQCKNNDSCIGGLAIEPRRLEGDTDSECASAQCKEDKCLGGAPPEAEAGPGGPKVWIGVAGSIDFFVMPAADNACALTSTTL